MSQPISSGDAAVCPICGCVNACAVEIERLTGKAQPPCWCMSVVMQQAVLARIPPPSRGLACVCQSCATKAAAPPPDAPEAADRTSVSPR